MTNIKQPKSWRDQIKVHPAADLLPMMTADELKVLGEDIKKNGMKVPVILWSPGAFEIEKREDIPIYLLDGRSRLDGLEAVGVSIEFTNGKLTADDLTPDGNPLVRCEHVHEYAQPYTAGMKKLPKQELRANPYDYVLSANVHRRHLTTQQKLDLLDKVMKANPTISSRRVAKLVGASPTTATKRRHKLEAKGDVSTVDTSTDTKGRKQPTRKPATKKKRRDIDDYMAEKKVRTATKGPDANTIVPIDTVEPIGCVTSNAAETMDTATANTITLREQVNALLSELAICGEWCKAHPDSEATLRLVSALKDASQRMQTLAQEIEGRNPTDKDEAARAPAEPPVGDDLGIPPFLRRSQEA